jgi:hypothetical protein
MFRFRWLWHQLDTNQLVSGPGPLVQPYNLPKCSNPIHTVKWSLVYMQWSVLDMCLLPGHTQNSLGQLFAPCCFSSDMLLLFGPAQVKVSCASCNCWANSRSAQQILMAQDLPPSLWPPVAYSINMFTSTAVAMCYKTVGTVLVPTLMVRPSH